MPEGRGMLSFEVLQMNLVAFSSLYMIVVGVWFIFLIWVLWMIVKSLKSMDASLKEIARNGSNKL
jgi:hypothetical protein